MEKIFIISILSILSIMQVSCKSTQEEPKLKIETNYGDITIKLHKETPFHRNNFMKLVKSGTYNDVLFHRVIEDFMIQTGDPTSKKAKKGDMLGTGDVGYTIPAEFVYPQYYHKRGALAAARQGDQINPKKESSGCQFYIVQGRTFTDEELKQLEKEMKHRLEMQLMQKKRHERQAEIKQFRIEKNEEKLQDLHNFIMKEIAKDLADESLFRFTPEQIHDYKTIGGTPHLDGEYTVFGEVIEGFDVVEKISKTATGRGDRPLEDIKILKIKEIK